MGTHYGHVTLEERCEMARLQATGQSIRQIAATLDRAPSTVTRELKRNRAPAGAYQPVYADQQARARRWRGSRLERDAPLRTQVLAGLHQGWSPEQVAGRLKVEAGRGVISHESIYRFLYRQLARTEGLWVAPLPAAGQVETGLARPQGGQSGRLHRAAPPAYRAPAECRRPPYARALGGRSDALPRLWPGGADPA